MRRAARGRGRATGWALAALLLAAPWLGACSVRKLAVRTVANAMASGTDVYATDDDPELVGQALPFALKTLEGLLAQDPTNRNLLLATSRGFTQYAFAFVQLPAQRAETEDFARAEQLRARAIKLFLRARDYAVRGLAVSHPGIDEQLRVDPAAAAATLGHDDLPLAYWAAAAWGSAITVGKDRPELLADFPAVRALGERGLALEEGWSHGALHALMLSVEAATPAALGGSPAAAKQHYERAIELGGGKDALVHVNFAESVAVPAQDRAAFDEVLNKALAIDIDAEPELRLGNVLAQEKARWLLENAGDYFLTDEPATDEEPDTSDEAAADAADDVDAGTGMASDDEADGDASADDETADEEPTAGQPPPLNGDTTR
jgi:predicted anti-sigma-YlaC factor YlaD